MASSARIDELKKKFDENPRRYFAPLANEYRKVGDLEQAIFICQAYLPQQPGHMSGHIVYAQTLFEMGRHDEAKDAFEAALALDPENLIALRHLGDIAKLGGNLVLARGWYERVLEADPRNEEIVEAMASLRTAPPAPAAPSVASAPPSFDAGTPPMLRTPALSSPPPATARPSPIASAPATPPADDDFETDNDLLDLDDMTIGAASPSAVSSSDSQARDSDGDDEAFESDPLAIAAHELSDIELATDLKLGLVNDSPEPEVAPTVDAPVIEGLRSYEAGVLEKPTEIVDSGFEMEPFYDVLHGEPPRRDTPEPETATATEEFAEESASVDSVVSASQEIEAAQAAEAVEAVREIPQVADAMETHEITFPSAPAPADREPTPAAATEIFVTETMAELYLQQGHLDSALDIYRKLLEQRPNDSRLVDRVRFVEDRVFGRSEKPAVAAEVSSPSSPLADEPLADAGPTIREFLLSLIGGRGAGSSGSNGTEGHSASMSRHTLPGSIDAMFPAPDQSGADSTSATALAEAFGLDDFDTGLENAPRADSSIEAPLDQALGGATQPHEPATDGFSFDQFFAGDANAPLPRTSGETKGPPVESPDDVAQFNAWLNGLKKT